MTLLSNEALADVIDGAADQIEMRGWTQRTFYRKRTTHTGVKGAVCMMGGVYIEIFGEKVFTTGVFGAGYQLHEHIEQVRKELLKAIHKTGSRAHNVYGWNDYWPRTQQQVLDLMRATAKDLRMRDARATEE